MKYWIAKFEHWARPKLLRVFGLLCVPSNSATQKPSNCFCVLLGALDGSPAEC